MNTFLFSSFGKTILKLCLLCSKEKKKELLLLIRQSVGLLEVIKSLKIICTYRVFSFSFMPSKQYILIKIKVLLIGNKKN